MLSDIYGLDKKEKYIIIFNLLKSGNIFGIVYGKEGVGKKYIVEKAVDKVLNKNDKKVFLEANPDWYKNLLREIGTSPLRELSKEEFFLNFVDFIDNFSGRIFIVINNVQKLSETQIIEIYHLIGIKEKVSTILIGDESLKPKLNPFKIGKIEASVNFIFEVKPPEFSEFERYFLQKYGGKIEKKAIKKLYILSEGSIGRSEGILSQLSKFPIKGSDLKIAKNGKKHLRLFATLLIVLLIFFGYLLFFKREEKKNVLNPEKVIKMDKKLPVEGSVIQNLPVKTKKKKKTDILYFLSSIKEGIKNVKLESIPKISFYKKPIRYVIQIGSFRNENNALKLKEKISKDFFGVKIINRKNGIKSVVVYASNKEEAGKIISKLKKYGINPILKKVK